MAERPRRTPYAGRVKPYTARGIVRQRCARCGEPARFQWSACANGNRWVPVCAQCDVELNAWVLGQFFALPNAAALMAEYRERVLG
jgi:hypothetical protein